MLVVFCLESKRFKLAAFCTYYVYSSKSTNRYVNYVPGMTSLYHLGAGVKKVVKNMKLFLPLTFYAVFLAILFCFPN